MVGFPYQLEHIIDGVDRLAAFLHLQKLVLIYVEDSGNRLNEALLDIRGNAATPPFFPMFTDVPSDQYNTIQYILN